MDTHPTPFVILHIPHAATTIPPEIRRSFLLFDSELDLELLRMTDAYVDELFTLGDDQAAKIIFPYSRLVVDPERLLDDAQEPMAKAGMGVIYTRTSFGRALRNNLSAKDRHMLIVKYYIPHHERIENAVHQALASHGRCLIIDCHSFASTPLPHEPDRTSHRPDICIGTDAFHTPQWLSQGALDLCREQGFRAELNRPFSGTFVPDVYFRETPDLWSIMIEVNRSLYMDESRGSRTRGFEDVKTRIKDILSGLAGKAKQIEIF